MHRLLRMGRVNEVVALTDYMIGAEGISEGQQQLVLRLLQSNVDLDEEVIRKAAQLSKRELALLKKKANGTKT